MSNYWVRIKMYSSHYDQLINDSFKHAYNIYKFNLAFAAKIKFISAETSAGITGAINKFD